MIEKIGVFCASSDNLDPVYYKEAERLGHWIGESGKTLVYGGARCGLMEAVAQGVRKAGCINVIGVVPKILIEREMVSDCIGIKIPTEGLNDRKMWLNKVSDVLVALPGSVGTLDEAFTVIGEHCIGLSTKKVIFWNINGFWNGLFRMLDEMKATGVQNKPIDDYVLKADTLEEVVEIINKITI